MTWRCLSADLHVHTCLSPCSELEMSPREIVRTAVERGLDAVAITDHNSAENVDAVVRAAASSPLVVIPGMEITSMEEVHVLAFFPTVGQAQRVQQIMYAGLGSTSREEYVQEQVLANEHDEVEGFCDRLLVGSSLLSLERVVRLIHEEGGLAVAAHIDRQAYGILGVLGFIPPRLVFDALEVSPRIPLAKATQVFPAYAHLPFTTGSDAHRLQDLGSATTPLWARDRSLEEVWMALRQEAGRRIAPEGCP